MHEDVDPPVTPSRDDTAGRYRTLEFEDGLLIFDREATAGWIHSDTAVSLADVR